MSQKIEVPISAKVDERGVDKLDDALVNVAKTTKTVEQGARAAGREISELERKTRQLAATQAMLSRHFGVPVSQADAERFTVNFDRMRSEAGPRSRLRRFADPTDWYQSHAGSFTRETHARHHRALVFGAGMRGTELEANRPLPGEGEGSQPWSPNPPNQPPRGSRAALSAGMGVLRGGLALAGIGSVMGVLSSAMSQAERENEGIDTLKRRMGDVGVNFGALRARIHGIGVGYGVSGADSAALAAAYAEQVGNLRAGDMDAMAGSVRGGIGFGRAYGMDPSEGVNFFGAMRRGRVVSDDQSQRRFALMLADAIEKGGFVGAAKEVLHAVQQYTEQSARATLTAPNVQSYMSALANLTSKNYAGMDPTGAAALLGTADANFRRGGAFGQASLNLIYSSLKDAPGGAGMDVFDVKALMEGGLFATTASTFYGNNPMAKAYEEMGRKKPPMSFITNGQRMNAMLKRHVSDPRIRGEMMANAFGLQSMQAGMALGDMLDDPVTMSKSEGLLKRAGVDLTKLNDSGMQTISQISAAKSKSDLKTIYDSIMNRSDINDGAKRALFAEAGAATKNGDFAAMQTALIKAVGATGQEKSIATETRDASRAIADALTKAGSPILQLLNPIRMGIEIIAKVFAGGAARYSAMQQAYNKHAMVGLPDSMTADGSMTRATDYNLNWNGINGPTSGASALEGAANSGGATRSAAGRSAVAQVAINRLMARGRTRAQAAGLVGNWLAESNLEPNGPRGDGGRARGIAQAHPDRWAAFEKWAAAKGVKTTDLNAQIDYFGVDEFEEGHMSQAKSKLAGAQTAQEAARVYALYGERPAGATAAAQRAGDASNVHNISGRVANAEALMPLPAAVEAAKAKTQKPVAVKVGGEFVLRNDRGKEVGRVPVRPISHAVASGYGD